MQPMAAITEKSFSENISLHTAENIETIISTSPKQGPRNILVCPCDPAKLLHESREKTSQLSRWSILHRHYGIHSHHLFSCLLVVTIIFTGSGFKKAVGKIPPQDQIGLSILLLSFLLTISGLPHHGGFGFSTIARCPHLYNATQ